MYWISQNSSSWNKYFEQTADIDLSTASPDITTWDSGKGWTPIAFDPTNTKAQQFFGNYNGKGHFISGLYISRPNSSNVGLFSHLGFDTDSVAIRNLTLKDVTIAGGRGTGSLMGRVTGNNKTLIEKCAAINGTVIGDGATGGLVGSNNSWKDNANANTFQPIISMCYAHIDVSWSRNPSSSPGADKFGGLTGCNQKGKTINSYSIGTVTVNNNPQVGSLIPERIGGIAGCTIYVGEIINSYSATQIIISRETENEIIRVGGLVGLMIDPVTSDKYNGTVTASFWDTDVSNQSTSAGGTGKTTSEMKTLSTYTDAGWDFTNTWEMIGSNYPRLQENPDASLPVTLTAFTAKPAKGTVVLEWETSAEVENQGFLLSREERGARNERNGFETHPEIIASFVTHDALKGQGSTTETTQYRYVDATAEPGKTYVYTLADVDYEGRETRQAEVEVKVKAEGTVVAENYALDPIYPNPFNARFTLPFSLNESMHVTVDLFTLDGRKMMTVVDHDFGTGNHNLMVNMDNLASGLYVVRTIIDGRPNLQKVVLLK